MASKKIFTVFVVLLLVANLITLVIFWLGRPGSMGPAKGGPAKFIIEELGFTKDQEKQFLALAREHQDEIRPVRDELRQAKDDFFSLLSQPTVTDNTKLNAAKNVSRYTEEIDLITLDHFAKVRKICTPQQREKFDRILKQITQMMGMPHPGGERQGPHGMPPPEGPHELGPPGP